jgi:hypothetical protein
MEYYVVLMPTNGSRRCVNVVVRAAGLDEAAVLALRDYAGWQVMQVGAVGGAA